jgi:hypothetical protein
VGQFFMKGRRLYEMVKADGGQFEARRIEPFYLSQVRVGEALQQEDDEPVTQIKVSKFVVIGPCQKREDYKKPKMRLW